MQFSKLKLTGFKSFVEATELFIHPGLTGIVGPNGCGKSNLVESLRWVMGETSAKQMRGGEMDDVIFNGSSVRPARNVAEVGLTLENAEREAPAQFNDSAELDVVRRIERGAGSIYKVNGREVRARDVQLLFADADSGARSTALVSQGHIGDIISAKPTQRRHLLEEAAGITGLHSRRHEAELRLNSAETNLERVNDLILTLEEQLKGLKRQARQASRYRNLSGHIRRAEAVLLHARWTEALTERGNAEERLKAAEADVAEATRRAAEIATNQANLATDIPDLRMREAEAAAALQRLLVARDALEAEEIRIANLRSEIVGRLTQIAADAERERALKADATAAIDRLAAESTDLANGKAHEVKEIERLATALAELAESVSVLDTELTDITRSIATDEAEAAALHRRASELEERRGKLLARRAELDRERSSAEAELADSSALSLARSDAQAARERLLSARADHETSETARGATAANEGVARDALQSAETAAAKLRAEESAIAALIDVGNPDLWPPMIDAVTVTAGYESALGAALGDELSAPADEAAPVHWRTLADYDHAHSLPPGVEPLARHVQAPLALARRIGQIGLVDSIEAARALQCELAPGQRLVTRDGALFRWDGYSVSAGAPTSAATRLAQRARLVQLRSELVEDDVRVAELRDRHGEIASLVREAVEDERAARESARAAERVVEDAQATLAAQGEREARAHSRLQAAIETADRVIADLEETEMALAGVRREIDELPDLDVRRKRAEESRRTLADERAGLAEARSGHDALLRDAQTRARRLGQIENEIALWRNRAETAERQIVELEQRRDAANGEDEKLAARPVRIALERGLLFDQIGAAEEKRRQAADALAAAENTLAEVGRSLRSTESHLADLREDRVRRESDVMQIVQAMAVLIERMRERLDATPETILAAGDVDPDEPMPERSALEARLERLVRERDTMGPVNLRAEIEASELESRIQTMQTERDDLLAAIGRLRQAIAGLNREGRERLLAAFGEVDKHFQDLFKRLFGGGHAHLAFAGSDDPLEAGLEIMASPPGKKLQALSLLSGGEQALTALALLFGVFLTNPAPICVLDEVDAPLDDSNVDRFCDLVREIAQSSATRFLLITHHRITMARMDRLFGVTMTEQGVSQLVSVDLETAEQLRATA